MKRRDIIFLSVFIFSSVSVWNLFSQSDSALKAIDKIIIAEDDLIPVSRLDAKDANFKLFTKSVTESYKFYTRFPEKTPEIDFYFWYGDDRLDLVSLASRLNLRQDTIASLNRISNPKKSLSGKKVIFPTANGIFIPQDRARGLLESILKKKCFKPLNSVCYNISGTEFLFIPDGKFDSTERAIFLEQKMTSPLPDGILSSDYGERVSPISGNTQFHGGVDLAAPMGTPVKACKSGLVQQTGYDSIYGNFLLISHDGRLQTLYAHLSKILVKEGDLVVSGQLVANVGESGLATGPHLHFEIRNGNKKLDPNAEIRIKK